MRGHGMLTQEPKLHGDVEFPLLGVCLAPPDRRVSGGGSACDSEFVFLHSESCRTPVPNLCPGHLLHI